MKQDATISVGDKPHYKSDVILGYLKALAWPGLTLLILIVFWAPLRQIANMAPSLLSRSESIKIGSVSLVVGKDVVIPDAVRQVLRSLRPDDLDDFLASTGDGAFTSDLADHQSVKTWRRWASLGLLKEMSASELAEYRKTSEYKDSVIGFNGTPLYHDTRTFLINLLPEILKKAERESTSQNGTN